MLNKVLLIIFLSFSLPVIAGWPQYIETLPSTSQKLSFSISTLNQFLIPMGYELKNESVNIYDKVYVPGISNEVIISTPLFGVKYVSFSVIEKSTKKNLQGHIYLIVAVKDIEAKLKLDPLNSTSKTLQSFTGNDKFIFLFSRDFGPNSFSVDISPEDFHLLTPF